MHLSRAKRTVCGLTAMLMSALTLHAGAFEGRLYNQYDPYWETVKFEKYCKTQNSMYVSGCGIFSFCNAIYALNSTVIDAPELGEWGVNNGSYRPGNGGLYRDIFYKYIQEGWGEKANFTLVDCFSGDVTDERLINHLKAGGVAVVHVPYHFMAITGYNEDDCTYHIIESACNDRRNIPGDSWQTVWKMTNGRTQGSWFALLANTKAPEFAEVQVNRLQSAVGLSEFKLCSDIKGDFALGIDNAAGERVATCYSYDKALSCDQYVRYRLTEAGDYSCYVTSQNEYGMFSSEPVSFQVFDEKPSSAAMSIDRDLLNPGETAELTISGGIATSYQLHVYDRDTGEELSVIEETANFDETESHTITWTPPRAGYLTLQATLVNDYGTAESGKIDVCVLGDVPVTFDCAGGEEIESRSYSFLEPYSILPKPVKEDCIFDGWFTEAEGGERIQRSSYLMSGAPHVLYAHWSPVPSTTDAGASPEVLPVQIKLMPGDVNLSGAVDIADLVLLKRLVTEDDTLTVSDAMLAQADVNGDGLITVLDFTTLCVHMLRLG